MSSKVDLEAPLRAAAGITRERALHLIAGFNSWYHRVEVLPGVFTPGINDSYTVLEGLELPKDLSGARVLDIGARDGFFSLICEQRGAERVVALDHQDVKKTGFPVLQEIFNARVEYFTDNFYDLSVQQSGQFDLVLCLGLLYHLRDPLHALSVIRQVCASILYVESFVSDQELAATNPSALGIPVMRFYPKDELDGDHTNWWGPNSLCLKDMVEATNFSVLWQRTTGNRSILRSTVNNSNANRYYREIERGRVLSGADATIADAPIIGNPGRSLSAPPVLQASYTVNNGELPEAAVTTATEGTLGSATVTVQLDLGKVLAAAFTADASYNVYVGALVPRRQLGSASDSWFVNVKDIGWQLMDSPIASYLQGVATGSVDRQIVIDIVRDTDITALMGTEVYIGYGTSDEEMLSARRYRGVYKVQ